MNDLVITTREGPADTVVTVSGEMDLASCPALEEATRLAPPHGAPLCLDLAEVTFMDSSGLNFLLILQRRLAKSGSRLVLRGLQEGPMRVLTLTGADAVLLPADEGARGAVRHTPAV
ncbi:STAS domain-containing protein [Streptomyces sp. NPDC101158]|uniref:STAS domain-containing protein n=1 Tax=Streptomyces sp. NPDC101158 TaxID=3366117 RepID=UPI0037F8B18B